MIHWKAIFKADRFLSTQGVFAAREKPYFSAPPRSHLLTCFASLNVVDRCFKRM